LQFKIGIHMRTLFLAFISLIILVSCQESQEGYVLKGNAFGFDDDTAIVVFTMDENNQSKALDTLLVKNQKFEASYSNTEDTEMRYLKVGNTGLNVIYFTENQDLTAQLYADSLSSSKIIGGAQNEIYYTYLSKIVDFSNQKQDLGIAYKEANSKQDLETMNNLRTQNILLQNNEKEFKVNYLAENKNSLFGVILMNELFTSKSISALEAQDIIDGLSPKLKQHAFVKRLEKDLVKAKKSSIGSKAPNFEAPTPNGDSMSLEDALGTYTIIDFWASWCKPCRMENPNVVRVYNKYHDKGLNIISVSLDRQGQKERWLKAINDDNMDWFHVSNLQFWQDPIAREYNVSSIPATFLLDENGVIIDKNLRGPALEAKIASLLD